MHNDVREFYIGTIDRAITKSDGTQKDLLRYCVCICVYVLLCVIIRPFRVP